MNHVLAVSALVGSILDTDHVVCLKYRCIHSHDHGTESIVAESCPRATREGMICQNARFVPYVSVFQTWYTPICRRKHGTYTRTVVPSAPSMNYLLSVSVGKKLASVVCTLFAVAMTILHADCRSSGNPNLLLIANRQEMEKNL